MDLVTFPPSRLVVLIVGFTGSSACVVADLEFEIPAVCATRSAIAVPGVATDDATQGQLIALEGESLFAKLAGLQFAADTDSDFDFTSATLSAGQGLVDFAFVETAHVTLATDLDGPAKTLFACDDDCVDAGATLRLPAVAQAVATRYLHAPHLVVGLELFGQLPTEPWAFDLDVCVKGRIGYAFEL